MNSKECWRNNSTPVLVPIPYPFGLSFYRQQADLPPVIKITEMKKRITTICLILVGTIGCIQAQPRFEEVETGNGQKYLIGVLDQELLNTGPYKGWYEQGFNAYRPEKSSLENLKPLLQDLHILVFLGTWCGDSRREVPRFLKIMDEVGFPSGRIKLVGVDRRRENYKKSPGGEEWGLNILRVPTFIFLKKGKEVGRIVERPSLSLEQELCDLLSCSPSLPAGN